MLAPFSWSEPAPAEAKRRTHARARWVTAPRLLFVAILLGSLLAGLGDGVDAAAGQAQAGAAPHMANDLAVVAEVRPPPVATEPALSSELPSAYVYDCCSDLAHASSVEPTSDYDAVVNFSDPAIDGRVLRAFSSAGEGSVAPGSAVVRALDDVPFPNELAGGASNVHVYLGVRNGKPVYAGITNDLGRRGTQHADRFVLDPLTTAPVTRGQARAIEQALIERNPGFEAVINSISPTHSYYQQAVDWGEAWLQAGGY